MLCFCSALPPLSSGDVQKFRIGLAVFVSSVWLTGYVIAWTSGGQSPTELTGLEAIVLGWVFAGTIKDSMKRSPEDPK